MLIRLRWHEAKRLMLYAVRRIAEQTLSRGVHLYPKKVAKEIEREIALDLDDDLRDDDDLRFTSIADLVLIKHVLEELCAEAGCEKIRRSTTRDIYVFDRDELIRAVDKMMREGDER